jgi:hypothetical protein
MLKKNFIVLYLLSATTAMADGDSTRSGVPRTWGVFGMGFSSVGFTAGVGAYHQRESDLYSVRLTGLTEIPFKPSSPREIVEELGLLYGSALKETMSLSAGLSIVRGVGRGTLISTNVYDEVRYTTVGLALEGTFARDILPFVGFGLTIAGNINSRHSFGAVLVSIRVGELR